LREKDLEPHSILFDVVAGEVVESHEEPECFKDLNLDQIVSSVTDGRDDRDLKPYFYLPLKRPQTIGYRQAVFHDLEDPTLVSSINLFAQYMTTMRELLTQANQCWHVRQKQRGFLEAVDSYCAAVRYLARDLESSTLRSIALCAFRDYLNAYQQSDAFQALGSESAQLRTALWQVHYRLQIEGPRIKVSQYESDPDYGEEVARTFEKFRQDTGKRGFAFDDPGSSGGINSVDAAILDRVALLFPEVFDALEQYGIRHRDYLDPRIRAFDREIQFYLGYLEHIGRLRRNGLSFCYPEVSEHVKALECLDTFDLALAAKLARVPVAPVTNDVSLQRPERILVVSGANQGGKTTFARMLGQLHYLARLGCPVPGRVARVFLVDEIFTHFEREEDLSTLRSKLEDDLVRVHSILERATPRSLLVMNESFSSSTLQDALFLSKEILQRIIGLDLICVFVTFLDELSTLGRSTVSMVSTVKPEDPAQRTFKIVRKPADGLAYALAIAEKHGLTYERAKQRLTA
jgi:DNA mismatch repair protein MutS